jgi:hypothetical protein
MLRPGAHEAPGRAARLAAANSGALRAHFGALTAALLAPFGAFWQPTPPPPGAGPIPTAGPPHLPPFSHAEFLDSLAAPQAAFPQILLDRFANQVSTPCVALYSVLGCSMRMPLTCTCQAAGTLPDSHTWQLL